MWHYVRDRNAEPRVGAGWIEPAVFEAQLDAIGRSGTVVSWPAVAAALEDGPELPPDAVLLTFDDGLIDHYRTVMPRLVARGWPGTFFVMARRPGERLSVGHRLHVLLERLSPSELRSRVLDRLGPSDQARFLDAERVELAAGAESIDVLKRPIQRQLSGVVGPVLTSLIEQYVGSEPDIADALHLSERQIVEMRREGMTMGGHGRQHLWFDWEPARRVRDEIVDSGAWLEPEPRPWAFAYPYGAASPQAPATLRTSGFTAAFLARPFETGDTYHLGRHDAEDGDLDLGGRLASHHTRDIQPGLDQVGDR